MRPPRRVHHPQALSLRCCQLFYLETQGRSSYVKGYAPIPLPIVPLACPPCMGFLHDKRGYKPRLRQLLGLLSLQLPGYSTQEWGVAASAMSLHCLRCMLPLLHLETGCASPDHLPDNSLHELTHSNPKSGASSGSMKVSAFQNPEGASTQICRGISSQLPAFGALNQYVLVLGPSWEPYLVSQRLAAVGFEVWALVWYMGNDGYVGFQIVGPYLRAMIWTVWIEEPRATCRLMGIRDYIELGL